MTLTDLVALNPNYTGFDSITWYVGNALQASSFFVTRFGFQVIAYRGPETGSHLISAYVLSNGSAVMLFMAPIRGLGDTKDARASKEDDQLLREIHTHLTKHGDGVKDIAFGVSNVHQVWQYAVANGAKSIQSPRVLVEPDLGEVCCAIIGTYGDTTHSLIDRSRYKGVFQPGFRPVTLSDPVNDILPAVEFIDIDHCVGNQPWGGLETTVKFYEQALDFRRYWTVDDREMCSEYSAMRSVVVASPNEVIKMPLNEPAVGKKKSQIEEFVDYYNGAGCQHIAFSTKDIVETVNHLAKRGVHFLKVPESYYVTLRQRLQGKHAKVAEQLNILQKSNILVDFDEGGYLLQIFAKHVLDRPTVFIEIIQRENFDGFGAGNFKSLFTAFEQEQASRGNL
ncbi:4-hydroxyphenylpyruvate dioxygenase [Penicillium nucicola]|uniref:4-hydroxyphenylpyruvate dioxygenase n=1 Tax=Penicillium nucicola TaxID=1850975 RepID=UPI0025451D37|nr:4-hydroxyphenylpyruvate dioxygenase [Penicillium nucicola]KAJ5753943.1 4-hydroxyphenylpyruvate dioxygenase [Penicillium nucicola]